MNYTDNGRFSHTLERSLTNDLTVSGPHRLTINDYICRLFPTNSRDISLHRLSLYRTSLICTLFAVSGLIPLSIRCS